MEAQTSGPSPGMWTGCSNKRRASLGGSCSKMRSATGVKGSSPGGHGWQGQSQCGFVQVVPYQAAELIQNW